MDIGSDAMSWVYPLAPCLGYLAAGGLKFVINSRRAGRPAFDQIGLGGMPSTHTTIVATVAMLTGFREGIATPTFGIALALCLIVAIDAMDLRRKVGQHAAILKAQVPAHAETANLRERVGHTYPEVCAGLALGTGCALLLSVLPF